jgi:OOP family OmpA-OmpF porin
MNKALLIAFGIALSVPFAVHADDVYVGVNVGSATQKISAGGASGSENKTGAKIYAGSSINKNFGVEVGYVDFGKVSKSSSSGANSASFSVDSYAAYLAATAIAPVSTQFSLFAKLGLTANRSKLSGTLNGASGSIDENHTDTIIGVGAAYAFSNKLSAVVEYENFGKVVKGDGVEVKADLVSLGLRYKF